MLDICLGSKNGSKIFFVQIFYKHLWTPFSKMDANLEFEGEVLVILNVIKK